MPQPKPRTSCAGRRTFLALVVAAAATVGIAPPAGAATKPKAVVRIAPGETAVHKTGEAPDSLPDDVRDAVMSTLTGYLKAATVKPLQKGKPASDAALGASLAPAVAARLAGADRAVLVDEGLPKAASKIVVSSSPVALTGLADGSGSIVVVTANMDATTTTKTAKGKLRIARTGELVLEQDGGSWKITGYTLTVERVGKGIKPAAGSDAPATAPTPTAASR